MSLLGEDWPSDVDVVDGMASDGVEVSLCRVWPACSRVRASPGGTFFEGAAWDEAIASSPGASGGTFFEGAARDEAIASSPGASARTNGTNSVSVGVFVVPWHMKLWCCKGRAVGT